MNDQSMRLVLAIVMLGAVLGGAACAVARGEPHVSGQRLYDACQSCHGPTGNGDVRLGAPKIAGLPHWYIASQLHRFQKGLRGKHPDDVEGLKMRAMSQQMLSDSEIDAVSRHVSGLPRTPKVATAHGDPKIGQQSYAVCSACHGQKGEGNEQLNAPPVGLMEDWYVARQIRKFQAGIRGRVPDDAIGLQMAGMAMTVPAESIDHVAEYLHGLSN